MGNLTIDKKPSYLAKVDTVSAMSFLKALEKAKYLAQLKLDSKAFVISKDGELLQADPPHKIRCVIIAAKSAAEDGGETTQRRLFSGAYVEGEGNEMKCYSDDGVAPSDRAPEPQHSSCTKCHWNHMGTDQSGREGKGCKLYKTIVLAVLGPNGKVAVWDTEVDTPEPMILQFDVPLTSLKNLTGLANVIEDVGVHHCAIITEMTFAKGFKYPVIEFAHVGYVKEKAFDWLSSFAEEDEEVKSAITVAPAFDGDVDPYVPDGEAQEEAPAKKTNKKKAKAPMVDAGMDGTLFDDDFDDDDDEEDEPVQAPPKEKKAAPVVEEEDVDGDADDDDDLMADMDDWDDDEED